MVISQLVWTSKRRGEDWPALLRRLYQGMTGSDEQDVYGCCKCLYMVCEELPHSDAYSLLPTIAPTIFTIVSNNNVRVRSDPVDACFMTHGSKFVVFPDSARWMTVTAANSCAAGHACAPRR